MSVTGAALAREALVIDTHVHAVGFVPAPFASAYRFVNRRTMPPDVDLAAAHAAGVDGAVVKAVGDAVVTRWYGRDRWAAVLRQLDSARAQVEQAGGAVVVDRAGIETARAEARFAAVLGVEGADAIGTDLARVDELVARGVRVVVPVHLGDNAYGTTSLPWQRYVGPIPVRRRPAGLSELGEQLVRRLQQAGVLVDLAHADTTTLGDVIAMSDRPVAVTHTGARARADFPRFLTDDEITRVAATGGVMGLWPYRRRRTGVSDLADLAEHARHIAKVSAPEHVCLGTDMNGVPGTAAGYRGPADLGALVAALLDAGFSEHDTRGILGANFLRVLDAAAV